MLRFEFLTIFSHAPTPVDGIWLFKRIKCALKDKALPQLKVSERMAFGSAGNPKGVAKNVLEEGVLW